MYSKERWLNRTGISRLERICHSISRKIMLAPRRPIRVEIEDGLDVQETKEVKKELESVGWEVRFVHRKNDDDICYTDVEIW